MKNYYNYEALVFNTRKEAEQVIKGMLDVAKTYSFVTVADMYDLAGTPCSYVDNDYGWVYDQIKNIYSKLRKDGRYEITLPSPYPINETDEQNKQKHKYVSYNQKKEDINILVRVAEMENTYDAMLVINDIIQANRGRKINITIE